MNAMNATYCRSMPNKQADTPEMSQSSLRYIQVAGGLKPAFTKKLQDHRHRHFSDNVRNEKHRAEHCAKC